jgi:peptide-methionine (S)-S-oxide reductase
MNKILYLLLSVPVISQCQTKAIKNNNTNQHITKNLIMDTKDSLLPNKQLDTITLGAGCFWCVEAVFQQLNGVETVVSGYSGGHVKNPTYEEVCDKTTGHAEVVQVVYDKSKVTTTQVLEVFWLTHDPTTLNRQGGDAGPQYRSAVFYHNQEQKQIASQLKQALDSSGTYTNPIVTEITEFTEFYSAESYHQNYYNLNKNKNPYCSVVITPKIEKFRKVFKDKIAEPKL